VGTAPHREAVGGAHPTNRDLPEVESLKKPT